MKKIITVLLCSMILSACSHYVVNSAGFTRPPSNYKFSYARKAPVLTNNDLIDTTAIYYLHDSNYYKKSDSAYKHRDEYIRFYASGQFKMQGLKAYPTIEDVNDINKGIVGYYKLEGRVIKLQIYGDIDGGSNQLEFGMINENKELIILHDNPRTDFQLGYSEKGIRKKMEQGNFNPKKYETIKLKGMTYTRPNW